MLNVKCKMVTHIYVKLTNLVKFVCNGSNILTVRL